MSTNVSFFAGPDDDRALRAFIAEKGWWVVRGHWGDGSSPLAPEQPEQHPLCYASPLPPERLHPYGAPDELKVGWATDPLVELLRSYLVAPHLVAGRLWWSDAPDDLAAQSKPVFAALRRWVAAHWRRREEDGYFIGPHAQALVAELAVLPVYLPPGVPIRIVKP